MQPSSTLEASPRRTKFWIGGAVILAALVALVAWAMTRPGSTAFYMTPTEVLASGELTGDYRMNGTVVPGSIERDGLHTTFSVSDGSTEVEVTTDRPLPDTFRDRSEVVAKGAMEGDTFVASEVLAKCPSKFKARA